VAWAGKRALGVAAIVWMVVVGLLAARGFSEPSGDPPPPKPTAAQVRQLVAKTRAPVYWFGSRLGRYELSDLDTGPRGRVDLSYGRITCDRGSDCWAPVRVSTAERDIRDLYVKYASDEGGTPSRCWGELGRAVTLLQCDHPADAAVLTGSRLIFVTSIEENDETGGYELARGLKPLNGHAPAPLPAPRPLSCRELKAVSSHYRAHMPRSLRPRKSC
jgi:hypothetical protein